MRFLQRAIPAFALSLLVACADKAPPPEIASPPTIDSFSAEHTRIEAGQSVRLSFTASRATSAELVDASGSVIPLDGDASAGSATVSPTATSVYILRVKGDGGRDTAFVQVGVGEDLREVFLAAIPSDIAAGESSLLLWSAPHARSVKLTSTSSAELPLEAAAGAGVVEISPGQTTGYTLVAQNAAGTSMTASASVTVRPQLDAFQALPESARPGETITLSWKSRGATEIVLSERTFGELTRSSQAEGGYSWTVPATLPSGEVPLDGRPLVFTLKVTQGDTTLIKTVDAWIGKGPKIVDFAAPIAATEGKPFSLKWKVSNAVRLQLYANGRLVYEPAANSAAVSSAVLPQAPLLLDTDYELVAWSHVGARTSQIRKVRKVKAPEINTFDLPDLVTAAGDSATATWTTTNATGLSILVKNGPAIFSTTNLAKVAASNTRLYPGVKTTFVLEAWNDAGDTVRREDTVDLAAPGQISANPTPALSGNPVDISWDMGPAVISVIGDPTQPATKFNPAADFFDLDGDPAAKRAVFDNQTDAVAPLVLDAPFKFPFVGSSNETFWVSVDGFLSFQLPGTLSAQANLDSASAKVPAMIAPFWSDLTLAERSDVLYRLEGAEFPRRLIIQWNKVQTDDPASELTFQVQLLESGEFRFAYKTLSGTNSGGETASIGWRYDNTLSAMFSSKLSTAGTPTIAQEDELVWFGDGPSTGQVTLHPRKAGHFTVIGRLQSGGFTVYPVQFNAIDFASVRVNEAMALPDPGLAPLGQWVELSNVTDSDVDLSGTVLASTANGSSWTLPEGTIIPARGYLVVGQSTDTNQNGEAGVQVEWSGFAPSTAVDDEIVLKAGGAPISSLYMTAPDLTPTRSFQAPERVMNSLGARPACNPTLTFGSNGVFGTPGAVNETCFDYRLSVIPVNYEDISTGGTALYAPGVLIDTSGFPVVLAAPFPYFGAAQPNWLVCPNGYVIKGEAAICSSATNKARPNVNDPKGQIAPFSDDLVGSSTAGKSNVFVLRMPASATRPAYTIIQWHALSHYPATSNDNLNFQVKLFDDGVIEYHFGTMVSGNTSNWATGTSATTWIERPVGDLALYVGANGSAGPGYMTSDVAYRFTPRTLSLP